MDHEADKEQFRGSLGLKCVDGLEPTWGEDVRGGLSKI